MGFDSREYEWADITLILQGRDVTGIRGVKYTEKIEREPLYAKGRMPQGIQSGNISFEGEFTFLQSEFHALQVAAGGSILRLKGLQANVSYGNPSNLDIVKTDALESIYFNESSMELKQGDKFMEVKLPFICLNIRPNIK